MINRQALLADLQKFLQRIEADLLERSESTEVPEVPAALRAEYEKASRAERTAQNYEDWRTDTITQAAAAWVLSCVFVRFLEDNSLIDPPKIAGPGERLARARDEHELYFRSHPQHTDREYLLSIFADLAKLPGTRDIFGEHNAINDLPNWLSGDAAGELLNFFQKIDASTGDLVHDFTDPNWDTRFLGDLYQDLSEAARKKFALLQTPDFVEEFILDRTLEPALDEFGLEQDLGSSNHGKLPGFDDRDTLRIPFKMIDPACGSGHFLLGAFPRLLNRWQRKEPGTNIRELTQRALNSIHGVDINPFAVAIAKFRLLLVAMKSCDIQRLADAPAFQVNVACGDSLLHGENRTSTGQTLMDFAEGATDQELYAHAYPGEDLQRVRNLLRFGTYHCVVANPPYIVPKDRKLNDWYRKRFSACHMKYSLAVPFMQQIFQLAQQGGFTGQITANSFMKREFGKKLIESFFPTVDLTHVIDTSGAYIPGHGTPTAILFGRQREPIGNTLRTVLGIRGEPSTPDNPAKGQVWTSITNFIDKSGEQDSFISSGDSDRVLFCRHPWSIGGGGASELKELIDAHCDNCLGDHVTEAGIMGVTGLDDAFVQPRETFFRMNCRTTSKAFILGEHVRDWGIDESNSSAFWPYDSQLCLVEIANLPSSLRFVWCYKSWLLRRKRFGTPMVEKGAAWYEWQELYATKLRSLETIAFSNVATHNHFTLSLDGSLFNSHGMALKLPEGSTRSLYFKLLGALNSSAGCFWIKQVAHNKGSTVDKAGARQRTMPFEDFFETGATLIRSFPIPSSLRECLAVVIDSAAVSAAHCSPKNAIKFWELGQFPTLADSVSASHRVIREHAQRLVHYQEELDWESYSAFGILPSLDIYGVDFQLSTGQRAFEIDLARRIASGETQSTWFERHSSTPITELPKEWPEDYKQLVERRIELIQKDPNLRLIEQPEYKRRWNTEPWESQLERALREWLLLRLETYFDFDGRMTDIVDASNRRVPLGEIAMYTVVQLADAARRDPQFMEVGELYRDDPAFDVQAVVEELVLAESVPHLPILRYKDSGLRKRAEWEKTWDLQRREDDIDAELKSAQESLKLAEQCVREKFNSELEELGKMRARLLEATTQAYIDLGQEVPSYEQKYEAEIHASVLLNQIGVKTMATAMTLNSVKDEAFKFQGDLDHKIRVACNEDITVLKCHNRLRAIPDKPEIMVPPKYTSADFISTGGARYWSLRGKLDVPKERWISFPHCEGPDGTLVICWAGYDHLQQAQAISAYYVRVQTEFGGSDDPRLIPLLASLIELLPWLAQWHNEPNANFDGLRMGDYFEGFVNEEARNLGKTLAEIKAWVPPRKVSKAKPTKSKKKSVQADIGADE
jgi:hypothetical protein